MSYDTVGNVVELKNCNGELLADFSHGAASGIVSKSKGRELNNRILEATAYL